MIQNLYFYIRSKRLIGLLTSMDLRLMAYWESIFIYLWVTICLMRKTKQESEKNRERKKE